MSQPLSVSHAGAESPDVSPEPVMPVEEAIATSAEANPSPTDSQPHVPSDERKTASEAEIASPAANEADVLAASRQAVLERIQQSPRLPQGLRTQLCEALAQAPVTLHDGGQSLLPAEAVLTALEAWAPTVLRLDPQALVRPEHPMGDAFFSGDPRQLSDEQAERIARQQLERSGYLPTGG